MLHPLFRPTGDLLDNQSSDGSTSTPVLRHGLGLPRRLSREVRSRMCRSLGTDLDQILQEEGGGGGGNETARLNRLHLISSSLSLRANLSTSSLSSCSTPPRCQSMDEMHEEMELKGRERSIPAAAATSNTRHEGHAGHGRQVRLIDSTAPLPACDWWGEQGYKYQYSLENKFQRDLLVSSFLPFVVLTLT